MFLKLQRPVILLIILLAACVNAQSADSLILPWSFSASANTYFVPDDDDYVQPSFTADHNRLHLEARYNYEDLETSSFWMGANFSIGNKVVLKLTPMLGGVFGNTEGVAAGYRGTIDWKQCELYSESEYLFDTNEPTDSYFYTWSELTMTPVSWLRAGLVAQRTQAYESEREIQSGFLIGVQHKLMHITANVFNVDLEKPLTVLSIGAEF